jgi:hemin uptake protein HemP
MAELRADNQQGQREARKSGAGEVSKIDSRMLLGRDGRILIRHKGQCYELRETRFGKLILTK